MASTRLDIEYDGTDFAGWARQPGRRTVQGELEAALAVLRRAPTALTVAGRTDRGVHAWGQVASYAGEPVGAINLSGLLPPDLAVRAATEVPDAFDARRDATSRTYCYRILTRAVPSPFERRTALHVTRALDRQALDACAAALAGTHDFMAFTPTETRHRHFTRTVLNADWRAVGDDHLELWIEADAFLRHMNRVLVGTMLEAADGRRTVESFASLLTGRPRAEAGPTAPAHGLALARVAY